MSNSAEVMTYITEDGEWFDIAHQAGRYWKVNSGSLLDEQEMARLVLDVLYGERPQNGGANHD